MGTLQPGDLVTINTDTREYRVILDLDSHVVLTALDPRLTTNPITLPKTRIKEV